MTSCDDVQDVLPELLPWVRGKAFEVHEHLRGCPECAELADELAHTVHRLQDSPGAPALGEGFAERVLSALPHDPGWSVSGAARPGRVIRLRTLLVQGAAAAACFAAGAALTLGLRERGVDGSDGQSGHMAQLTRPHHPAYGQGPMVVVEPSQATEGPLAGRGVPAAVFTTDPQPQPWQASAPAGWAPARLAGFEARPLVRYVSQAGLVVEAVAELDAAADPRALQVLRVTLQRSDLLDEGDQLLQLLPVEAGEPTQVELRRLIAGTQLVLRKVRNARQDAAPELLWALRREVRETGLLDAYRDLLTRGPQPAGPDPAAAPDPGTPSPPGRRPNDPL